MTKIDPVSAGYQKSFFRLSGIFGLSAEEQRAALGALSPDDTKTYDRMRVRTTVDALCELHGALAGVFCAASLPAKIRNTHIPDINGRIIDGICSGDALRIKALRSDIVALNGVC